MKLIEVTEEELAAGNLGRCTACGAEAFNVEPDAHGYICETCKAPAVCGLEELLLMGQLRIVQRPE